MEQYWLDLDCETITWWCKDERASGRVLRAVETQTLYAAGFGQHDILVRRILKKSHSQWLVKRIEGEMDGK